MDDYFKDADAYIAKNRIFKEIDVDEYIRERDELVKDVRGRLPDPEVELYECRIALKKDFDRPWGGNDYMFCPEMYCGAIKRKLEHELGEFFENYPDGIPEKPWYTVFPPADVLPFHDAIFVEGEPLELVDPRPEKKKRNWWDKEVLNQERGGIDLGDYSAAFRVDWYLEQTKKHERGTHDCHLNHHYHSVKGRL